MDKRDSAVDGIDNPSVFAVIFLLAEFFPDNAVVGISVVDHFSNDLLSLPVGNGHGSIIGFLFHRNRALPVVKIYYFSTLGQQFFDKLAHGCLRFTSIIIIKISRKKPLC